MRREVILMKKLILSVLVIAVCVLSVIVATKAAFEDTGKVAGSEFSVGNIQMRLLNSLNGGTQEGNLLAQKQGPSFTNLFPGWVRDYSLKLYNNGSLNMLVSSESNYTTAEDPSTLRDYINVEVFDWDDSNNDGDVESGEISGSSLAKKTLIKWKTEGIPLGILGPSEVKGYVLRFSSESLPDTKQNALAKYDFVFNGTTDGVSQADL